mgnify:CR=1 FL=1
MDSGEVSTAVAQFPASIMMVYLLQLLKKSRWFPLMKQGAGRLNFWVAAAVSGLAAFGVHMSFDPEARQIIIGLPTLTVFFHALWAWAQSLAMQHGYYTGVVEAGENRDRVMEAIFDLVKVKKP